MRSIQGASVCVAMCRLYNTDIKNAYHETSGIEIYETNWKSREQTDSASLSTTSNAADYARLWPGPCYGGIALVDKRQTSGMGALASASLPRCHLRVRWHPESDRSAVL